MARQPILRDGNGAKRGKHGIEGIRVCLEHGPESADLDLVCERRHDGLAIRDGIRRPAVVRRKRQLPLLELPGGEGLNQ